MKRPHKPASAVQLPLLLETEKLRPYARAHRADPRYLERRAMEAHQSKRCDTCNIVKPYREFSRRQSAKDQFIGSVANTCKDCELVYKRGYYMRRTYGITLEKYGLMFEAQEGKCAICKTPGTSAATQKTDHSKRGSHSGVLVVDHDHETMEVRGLLCSRCNQGVGHFSDNANLLHMAAVYLDEYRASSAYFTK